MLNQFLESAILINRRQSTLQASRGKFITFRFDIFFFLFVHYSVIFLLIVYLRNNFEITVKSYRLKIL